MSERKAIVIRNSPKPEPVFPVPDGVTPGDLAATLKLLADVGLDADVVPWTPSASAEDFRAKVAEFAAGAKADLARWEAGQRFIWKKGDVNIL